MASIPSRLQRSECAIPALLNLEIKHLEAEGPDLHRQGCQVGDFIAKLAKLVKSGPLRLNLFLIRKCVWLNLNPSLPVLASPFWRFLTLFRPNLAKFRPSFGYFKNFDLATLL